jgi:regulator of protease activity HflC (stomatin/prohibitin superfamily)
MDVGSPIPPPKNKWRRFVEGHLPIVIIYLMVATLVAAVLAPNIVVTVPSGHVGLLWKRFRGGTVLDPRLLKDEGLRILLPWDQLFLYDLRMQSTTDHYNAITKDGVNLTATINIRFRVKHDAVPQLHQAIGPNYVSLLVRPEIGSRMREVIAEYTAEEVYSTKRQEIQERILGRSEAMMGKKTLERTAEQSEYGEHYQIPLDKMINLYDTLVLGMELPAPVVAAINRKVEQYYLVQEYAFRVERERKESERKIIEAQGISEFQRIVSQGISDSYVRWRGIEATLQLAQSTNAKVVIIGSGKDGLPIILGNVDAPLPQPAAAPPADGNATPKQTTAAPATTRPSEKTPAVNLQTPPEATPVAEAGPAGEKAVASASDKQGAGTPPEQRSFWQRGLTEIEALFSRGVRPVEPQLKGPFDKPPPAR